MEDGHGFPIVHIHPISPMKGSARPQIFRGGGKLSGESGKKILTNTFRRLQAINPTRGIFTAGIRVPGGAA